MNDLFSSDLKINQPIKFGAVKTLLIAPLTHIKVCVLVCGTHTEGRFGADAMNEGACNIWIICLPLVNSDRSRFWLDAVAEFPYHRWGQGLESDDVKGQCAMTVFFFLSLLYCKNEEFQGKSKNRRKILQFGDEYWPLNTFKN